MKKYLNLTKGFDPYNIKNHYASLIEFESFTFSGGEPHIKLDLRLLKDEIVDIIITHRIETFKDMGILLLTVDSLRRINRNFKISLFLPYFPAARQDRVMVEGEAFSSAVYVKELDKLGFESITSYDVHSDVIGGMFAVLNTTFINLNNHKFVLKALDILYPQRNATTPYLVSPDAGANKKIGKLATYLSKYQSIDVIKCDKTRDVSTGEITGIEVYADDLKGRDCVIVDDIIDGGRTFIEVAKELKRKGAGDVHLIVSHGIFSKGILPLLPPLTRIITTDSLGRVKYITTNFNKILGTMPTIDSKLISSKELTVIPLNKIL